jgi:putative chitinase
VRAVSIDALRAMFTRPNPMAESPIAMGTGVPVHTVGDAGALPAVLRAAGMVAYERWAGHLAEPCRRFAITPGRRLAAFAATIAHESAGGTRLVESLNYTPAALMRTWPHRFPPSDAERMGRASDQPADQRAIAERAYGGRMGNAAEGHGDGWRFRGRGLIQITGRDGYRQAARATGLPLEDRPEIAEQEAEAGEIAAWVWAEWKRCNALADAGDIEGWRRAINGGLIGLADVRRRYEAALAA